MVALLVGFLLIVFGVYAVLPIDSPGFINWSAQVVEFLKGGAPIVAMLIGLVAFFIGIADIKDKMEARREAREEQEEQSDKQGAGA